MLRSGFKFMMPKKSQIKNLAVWILGIVAGFIFLYAVWRVLINVLSPK